MKPKDIETIKTGFRCNNRCIFCCFAQLRDAEALRPCLQCGLCRAVCPLSLYGGYDPGFKELALELARTRKKFDKILFLGGEVTIRPDVLELVRQAKKLGYKEIHIQTNGRRFSSPEFARAMVKAGAKHFTVSLHTADPAVADHLSGVRGLVGQVSAGIKNLKALGARVKTNTVLSRSTYKDAPETVAHILSLGVDEVRLSLVSLMGGVLLEPKLFEVKVTAVMPAVIASLKKIYAAKTPFEFEGIPKCSVSSWLGRCGVPARAAGGILKGYNENFRADAKSKREECRSCAYYSDCCGPWANYVEKFGWGEFKPVRAVSPG